MSQPDQRTPRILTPRQKMLFARAAYQIARSFRELVKDAYDAAGRLINRANLYSTILRFTRSPAKRRRSTRGMPGQPWMTKKHTPSRLREMREFAERSAA